MKTQRTPSLFGMLLVALLTFVCLSAFKPPGHATEKKYSYSIDQTGSDLVQVEGTVLEKFITKVDGRTYEWVVLFNQQSKEKATVQINTAYIYTLIKSKEYYVIRCKPLQTNYDAAVYRC